MQGVKIKPNEIKTITCLEKGNFPILLAFGFGRARVYGFEEEKKFVVISLHLLEIYPCASKKKGSLVEISIRSRYGNLSFDVWNSYNELSHLLLGNYPNSFFVYVWVRQSLTLIIKVFLVGLSQFYGLFLNGFCFGRKFSNEKGKKCLIYVPANASSPRRRSARLGKPEAPKFPVFSSPR